MKIDWDNPLVVIPTAVGAVLVFCFSLGYVLTYFEVRTFNELFETNYTTNQMFWAGDSIKTLHVGTKHNVRMIEEK